MSPLRLYCYWRVRRGRRISSSSIIMWMCRPGLPIILVRAPNELPLHDMKGCDFSALLWLASVFHLFFYPEPPAMDSCGWCISVQLWWPRNLSYCVESFFFPQAILIIIIPYVASEWAQRKFDILNIWGDDVSLFKFICRILCTITFRHQIVLVGWVKPSMSWRYMCSARLVNYVVMLQV